MERRVRGIDDSMNFKTQVEPIGGLPVMFEGKEYLTTHEYADEQSIEGGASLLSLKEFVKAYERVNPHLGRMTMYQPNIEPRENPVKRAIKENSRGKVSSFFEKVRSKIDTQGTTLYRDPLFNHILIVHQKDLVSPRELKLELKRIGFEVRIIREGQTHAHEVIADEYAGVIHLKDFGPTFYNVVDTLEKIRNYGIPFQQMIKTDDDIIYNMDEFEFFLERAKTRMIEVAKEYYTPEAVLEELSVQSGISTDFRKRD